MNAGIEAIHFGQLELVGRNDPEYRNWADLLRTRASLCGEEGPQALGDLRRPRAQGRAGGGRQAPARFPRVSVASQRGGGLSAEGDFGGGLLGRIYGRSHGGMAPSGWKCEHLPYLVEFDNFGGTDTPGAGLPGAAAPRFSPGDTTRSRGSRSSPSPIETSGCATPGTGLRNTTATVFWRCPAAACSRTVPRTRARPVEESTWYFANTKSPACPQGFSQEETIKAIWREDSEK